MISDFAQVKQIVSNLLVEKSGRAACFQFLYFYLFTLAQIYLIIRITRRFTFVRSHGWILLTTLLATVLVSIAYSALLLLNVKLWLSFILTSCYAILVEICVQQFDKGRSLIDVNAKNKLAFQTDNRLIRRCAIFVLTQTLFFREWILRP